MAGITYQNSVGKGHRMAVLKEKKEKLKTVMNSNTLPARAHTETCMSVPTPEQALLKCGPHNWRVSDLMPCVPLPCPFLLPLRAALRAWVASRKHGCLQTNGNTEEGMSTPCGLGCQASHLASFGGRSLGPQDLGFCKVLSHLSSPRVSDNQGHP